MNDFNIDDMTESKRRVIQSTPEMVIIVPEPEPTPMQPFTPEQVEFIQEMIERTIRNMGVEVDIRDSYDWGCNDTKRVSVSLTYRDEENYTNETISESSDTFSTPQSNSNDF